MLQSKKMQKHELKEILVFKVWAASSYNPNWLNWKSKLKTLNMN